MVGPEEDEEKEVEEFESVEDEEGEPQPLEEFETFDNTPPEDIKSSGFKARTGQIPGYEPTVEEVLSYAMGKTKDPSEPAPHGKAEDIWDDSPGPTDAETEDEEEVGDEPPSEDDVEEKDDLGDIFDEDEEKPE